MSIFLPFLLGFFIKFSSKPNIFSMPEILRRHKHSQKLPQTNVLP